MTCRSAGALFRTTRAVPPRTFRYSTQWQGELGSPTFAEDGEQLPKIWAKAGHLPREAVENVIIAPADWPDNPRDTSSASGTVRGHLFL